MPVLLVLVLSLVLLPAAALAAPDPPARHAVQPGETLAAIAAQYGSTVPAIVAANLLADPDQIAAGAVLTVPPAGYPLIPVDVAPGDTLSCWRAAIASNPPTCWPSTSWRTPVRLIPGQNLLVPAPATGRSLALPPGPIVRLTTSPSPLEQGETAGVRVWLDSSQPVSLTVAMDQQVVPLRQAADGSWWGLLAIAALAEPVYWPLDLRWLDPISSQETTFTWPVQVVDGGYPTYDIVLPPGKGDLLAPDLVRAETGAADGALESRRDTAGLARPLPASHQRRVPHQRAFGQRRSYNSGPVSGYHTGQDFAAPEGVPVLAPASGHGGAGRAAGGARQRGGHRPRRRRVHRLLAPVADRRPGRPAGETGRPNWAWWEPPASAPAITCTGKCASTASLSIPLQWTGKVFP